MNVTFSIYPPPVLALMYVHVGQYYVNVHALECLKWACFQS